MIFRTVRARADASRYGDACSGDINAGRFAIRAAQAYEHPAEAAKRELLEVEIGRVEREIVRELLQIRDLTNRLLHRDE